MSNRADLGVTKAQRVYLDKYKIMHFIGLNKEGKVAYNEARATSGGKRNYANSADCSHLDIYEDNGFPYPAGKQSGEALTVYRNEAGEIVSEEDITVDDVLKAAYELAEKVYKG